MSISMPKLKANSLTPTRVGVCAGNQEAARRAYVLDLKGREDRVCVIETKPKSRSDKPEPMEEFEEIQLDENPEHKTRVWTTMSPELNFELITVLQANNDIFA